MDFMEEKNVGLLSKSSSISEASWGKEEILVEAKKQLKLAGPLVSVSLLTYSVQVISVMFVGHLGELPLAGASMATSFASVTGFSLLKELCSALETFCGQSYGGKQYHLLGVHAQRAMLVLLLASVPLVIIWANTGPILVLLGQDPEISAEAGQYARLMIPGIFAFSIIQCATKFLQAQNDVVPMMVVAAITTGFHVAICWAFVFACGLGSRGAALANVTSYWINALLLVAYVKVSPNCKATWTGFSKDAFRGIPDFLKLSIPSAVMLTLEIWSFELMVLLSGFLPNPKLETSVMSISLNTCAAVYMIPTGLGSVISVRVSNELGAGRPKAARLAIWISMTTVLIETFLVATAMVLGRNVWGFSYSNERIVVKYVGQLLILIAILHVLDGIQAVLSGVVRGSGLQKIGAILIVAAYYVVGLPIAVTLAFGYQMGGKGLWMGIIAALLVQSLLLSILTIYIDWQKEVEKASGRLR